MVMTDRERTSEKVTGRKAGGRGADEQATDTPSKSQRKREAQAVLDMAQRLVAMRAARFARVQLPEHITATAIKARDINARGARKRETQYLAKQLREADIDPSILDQAATAPGEDLRRRQLHAPVIEAWADLLLEDPASLTTLVEACPSINVQRLRQALRKARNKPEDAESRRTVHEILAAADADAPLPPKVGD